MKMTKLIKDLVKNLLKLFNIKVAKIENEPRANILFLETLNNLGYFVVGNGWFGIPLASLYGSKP